MHVWKEGEGPAVACALIPVSVSIGIPRAWRQPGAASTHSGLAAEWPLNVYTGQNPRRHVVLTKADQMRTICTQILKKSCLLVLCIYVSFSPGVVNICR
jgi:hypothetical protein